MALFPFETLHVLDKHLFIFYFLQSFTFPCENLHLLVECLCFLQNSYVPKETLHFVREHKTGLGNTMIMEGKL